MKLITAIVREFQLERVHEALVNAGITRITVGRVSGHGVQKREEIYRGKRVLPNLSPGMRIEIAVNDEFVETAISAIVSGARSTNTVEGEIGDGKIFISPLDDCIRIRTGERGSIAI